MLANGCSLVLLGYGGLAGYLALVAFYLGITYFISHGIPTARSFLQWLGSVFFEFGGFWAIICIWGGIAWIKSTSKSAAEAKAQRLKWETAIDRWNKLYYCSRCDGVFELGKSDFLPPEQMMRDIYH